MAKLLIFLLLILGCGGTTHTSDTGHTYIGVSAYAIMNPNFPCDAFLEVSRNADFPALSLLWGTFGNDRTCISRWFEENKNKPHLIQIHFSNEVCRKKDNCGSGEFFGELTSREYDSLVVRNPPIFRQELRARLEAIEALIAAYSTEHTAVILSMGLEDQFSLLTANKLYTAILGHWPYEISRNPLDSNDPPVAPIHELHGVQLPNLQSPCIANLDGVSITTHEDNYIPSITREEFSDFIRNNCRCRAVFGWNAQTQGIKEGNPFVAPMGREFVWSRKFIEAMDGILKC